MRCFRTYTIKSAAPKPPTGTALIGSVCSAVMCGITVFTTFGSSAAAEENRKQRLAENDAEFLAIEKARELREIEHLAEIKKLSAAALGGGGGGDGDARTGKWKKICQWFCSCN